jgi:hypothetical protein
VLAIDFESAARASDLSPRPTPSFFSLFLALISLRLNIAEDVRRPAAKQKISEEKALQLRVGTKSG